MIESVRGMKLKFKRLLKRERPKPGTLVWILDGWDTKDPVSWTPGIYLGNGINRHYSSVLVSNVVESKHSGIIHVGDTPPTEFES